MTSKLADFSVIVCAYTEERWQDLNDAIESLNKQTLAPHEVIVVIDHNSPLFKRAYKQFNSADIQVIENHNPRGLSSARNSGISFATGSVIAFMDEDAVATPDWLLNLHTAYADQQVLGVGGFIEPLWLTGRPGWFPEEFDWVVGCTYKGLPTSTAQVRNLIGCNMSFRREVFRTSGGFRHGIGRIGTLPVGCEETELCIRAAKIHTGKVFIYEPQSRVSHRVPQARANIRYFVSRCYAEGLSKALVAKFGGVKDGLKTEWAYVQQTLPQGIFNGINKSIKEKTITGLAQAGAILLGLISTTLGYLVGNVREWWKPSKIESQKNPVILAASGREAEVPANAIAEVKR
jgi:glycosyltransferase involved in cell wall biosynthesis